MTSQLGPVGRTKMALDTPALLVDLAVMEGNIRQIAAACRDTKVAWRSHTKGIKMPAIAPARKIKTLAGLELVGVETVRSVNLSAEHARVELDQPNHVLKVGDKLEFVVDYSDTTVHLHEEMIGIRDGRAEIVWPILGRGKLRSLSQRPAETRASSWSEEQTRQSR